MSDYTPKPGDVWDIHGHPGIVLRVADDTVFYNHAVLRNNKWVEPDIGEIGAAALWEYSMPLNAFISLTRFSELLQRGEF